MSRASIKARDWQTEERLPSACRVASAKGSRNEWVLVNKSQSELLRTVSSSSLSCSWRNWLTWCFFLMALSITWYQEDHLVALSMPRLIPTVARQLSLWIDELRSQTARLCSFRSAEIPSQPAHSTPTAPRRPAPALSAGRSPSPTSGSPASADAKFSVASTLWSLTVASRAARRAALERARRNDWSDRLIMWPMQRMRRCLRLKLMFSASSILESDSKHVSLEVALSPVWYPTFEIPKRRRTSTIRAACVSPL